MKLSIFSCTLVVLLLIPILDIHAQASPQNTKPRTASLSGRITISGKPAANARGHTISGTVTGDVQGSGFIYRRKT